MLSTPVPTSSSSSTASAEGQGQAGNNSAIPKPQVKVTPEQTAKLRRDLDIVQGNMAVFAEMLSEVKPGQDIPPADFELLEVS